jgi:hypothetical protein
MDWVKKKGEWGPRRLCVFLNSWNLTIMRMIRASHDIKLFVGRDRQTATLTYYITNYATKKKKKKVIKCFSTTSETSETISFREERGTQTNGLEQTQQETHSVLR